ncbi:MAG: hypothetical protein WDA06_05590 [Phenylobacterium sp.]
MIINLYGKDIVYTINKDYKIRIKIEPNQIITMIVYGEAFRILEIDNELFLRTYNNIYYPLALNEKVNINGIENPILGFSAELIDNSLTDQYIIDFTLRENTEYKSYKTIHTSLSNIFKDKFNNTNKTFSQKHSYWKKIKSLVERGVIKFTDLPGEMDLIVPAEKSAIHMSWWIDWQSLYEIDSGGSESTDRATNILLRMKQARVHLPLEATPYENASLEARDWMYQIIQDVEINTQLLVGWSSIYTRTSAADGYTQYGTSYINNDAMHTNYTLYPDGTRYINKYSITCPNYRGIRWDTLMKSKTDYTDNILLAYPNINLPSAVWIDDEIYYDPTRVSHLIGDENLYNGCERCGSLEGAVNGHKDLTQLIINWAKELNPNIKIAFFRGFDFDAQQLNIGTGDSISYFPTIPGSTGSSPGLYAACESADPITALQDRLNNGFVFTNGYPTINPVLSKDNIYDFCSLLANNGAAGISFYYDGSNKIGSGTEENDDILLEKMEYANIAFEDNENNL